jgi:resuscitation-promoting factor RpfA
MGGIWACIRRLESGNNYAANTGNGYFGAYQFLPGSWNSAVSGAGYPQYANGRADLAPPAAQDAAAMWLQAHSGWGQWSTASRCGA